MSSRDKLLIITFLIFLGGAGLGVYHVLNPSYHELSSVGVLDFAAAGDGITDDSEAFRKAWKKACGERARTVNFIIESGKEYMLEPMRFEGPCLASNLHFQILGKIRTSKLKFHGQSSSPDSWLLFHKIHGLTVNGNGLIDGNGSVWWQESFLNQSKDYVGNTGPDALKFLDCKNLKLDHLNIVNSPKRHLVIDDVHNADISFINIISPGTSPNTDGIGIGGSTNIQLHYCTIQSGDDCVAISSGSSNINISNIACGPGHGISIGSLGQDGSVAKVEEIYIRDCTLRNTMNGLRIKTWPGGSGYARNILFEGMVMDNVDNPIIIDQHYCPHSSCSDEEDSAVKVSDITFRRVNGTTSSKYAVNLDCSKLEACTNIQLQEVDIRPTTSKADVSWNCLNAHGSVDDSNPPVHCLSD